MVLTLDGEEEKRRHKQRPKDGKIGSCTFEVRKGKGILGRNRVMKGNRRLVGNRNWKVLIDCCVVNLWLNR